MSEVAINYKGSDIATMNASGTKTLLTSGKYCEGDITVTYARPSVTPTLETVTKTYTPSTSAITDTITPSSGYDGIDEVDVTVNAMPTGTEGTPTATKGTVSNHSVSVTPSVTNTTGYITGSTKTGTAVTVTASELASGNKAITQNGTGIDVVGYSTVSVDVSAPSEMDIPIFTASGSSATCNKEFSECYWYWDTKQIYNAAVVFGNETYGLLCVPKSASLISYYGSGNNASSIPEFQIDYASDNSITIIFPPDSMINLNVTANGTYTPAYGQAYSNVTVNVPSSSPTIQSLTVTPTTSQQTFNASGVDGYKPVTVNAIPSEYIIPSGNKAITENGTGIDVAQYETVSVNVSGGGGGGSKQEATGTVTGDGTNVLQIPCAFAPQEIYIRGDLTGGASLRGVVSFTIIKDRLMLITIDSSTSSTQEDVWGTKPISGYNEENSSTEPFASYSNAVLTINTVVNSSSIRWTSGIAYSYDLIAYEE